MLKFLALFLVSTTVFAAKEEVVLKCGRSHFSDIDEVEVVLNRSTKEVKAFIKEKRKSGEVVVSSPVIQSLDSLEKKEIVLPDYGDRSRIIYKDQALGLWIISAGEYCDQVDHLYYKDECVEKPGVF